jgi:hypothetical protein
LRGDGWNDGPLNAGLGATPDAQYRAYYSTPRQNVNVTLVLFAQIRNHENDGQGTLKGGWICSGYRFTWPS